MMMDTVDDGDDDDDDGHSSTNAELDGRMNNWSRGVTRSLPPTTYPPPSRLRTGMGESVRSSLFPNEFDV